jgi:hypothetical protein
MRNLASMAALTLVFSIVGCDAYVDKSKYDESERQASQLRAELTSVQNDLKKAQQTIAEYQAHKYQFMNTGGRTWRFNTISGNGCIQLTSDYDWKQQKTKEQSCSCEDLFEDGKAPGEAIRKLYCGW